MDYLQHSIANEDLDLFNEKGQKNQEKKESFSRAVDLAKGTGKVVGAVAGTTLAAVTKQTQIGNFNGNINQYGYGKAYIKITRKRNYTPEHIQDTYGYPANTWVKLGDARGFVKVKDIKLSILGATQDELVEIDKLLKEGVFI